jgi:8-oxo-dGTP diphosphatase
LNLKKGRKAILMIKKTHCPYCGNTLTEKTTEGILRLFCGNCVQIIYENPLPAACLVTVDAKDQLLLVKRNVDPKKGFWCLPGGFMELNETPEEAALRELHEETGLFGKIDMLLGVTTNPSATYGSVLMTGFLVKIFEGIPVAGDDAEEIGWFDYKNLPEIAFDSHKNFIKIYYTAYAKG